MIEKPSYFEEAVAFFFKIILPAIMGVSIKIAIQIKKEEVTSIRIFLAYVVGVCLACLSYPIIEDSVAVTYVPAIVGVVAITGDKVAEYLIYKLNIDGIMSVMIDTIINILKKQK